MSNSLYQMYVRSIAEAGSLTELYDGDFEKSKKLHGAITTQVVRKKLFQWLEQHHVDASVSDQNVYIAGSPYEYNLLLVRKNAEAYLNMIYQPKDVLAIIVCKSSGLFKVDEETSRIAKAVNYAAKLNPKIRFGYLTLWEQIPVNAFKQDGTPTLNHWERTQKMLTEKVHPLGAIYSVTLSQSPKTAICHESSEDELDQFVLMLVG